MSKRIRARNLLDSFRYAFEGIWYALKTQRNMRIHCLSGTLAIILGFYFKINYTQLAMLMIVCSMVIVAEMFNTSVESVVDLYSRQRHPLAKIAKDVCAAAVLVSAITALLVGTLILGPPIFKYLTTKSAEFDILKHAIKVILNF